MVHAQEYGRTLTKPAFAAFLLSICVFAASIWIPLSTQPLGAIIESYLDNNSNKIEFWWIYNCTFVNVDLTEYYQQEQGEAYVDGVYLFLNDSTTEINVLFTPYQDKIIGKGRLSAAEWVDLSDSLIHSGIGKMERATEHPDYFPTTWPVELLMEVFFDDNTLFYMGYSAQEHVVYIQHGSWSGEFAENGWPIVTGYSEEGDWLEEAGHLQGALLQFVSTVVEAVPLYPV